MGDFNAYKKQEQLQLFLNQKFSHLFTPQIREELWKLIDQKLPQYSHLVDVNSESWDITLESGSEGIFWFLQKVQETEDLDLSDLFTSNLVYMLLVVCKKNTMNSTEAKNAIKVTKQEIYLLREKLKRGYTKHLEAKRECEMLLEKKYEWRKNADYFNYIEEGIKPLLYDTLANNREELAMEKTNKKLDKAVATDDGSLDTFLEDYWEDVGVITVDEPAEQEGKKEVSQLEKELEKSYIDPIVFFHTIQKVFRKHNYVLTFDDIARIKAIRKDIADGKLLFLSGDTGSGKTELAIMIAKMIIKDEKEKEQTDKKLEEKNALSKMWEEKYGDSPIIVGGNRSTDMSDFTLEKIITSRNYISSQEDDLWKLWFNTGKELFNQIVSSAELKGEVEWMLEDIKDPKTKKEAKQELEKIDMTEYNIFTEHHFKGMFLAMRIGRPVLIDELNAIRPEILIGLNHYFTRKVGERIQLPNGLGSFRIKEWFCIISTGNDKDTNVKKDMYLSRYTIDESLINRMNIYQKGYMKQIEKQFENRRMMDQSEWTKDVVEYLQENELFGVLLMLFFEKWKSWEDIFSAYSSKVGFELIKEYFVKESDKEKRNKFFAEISKFGIFISKSQRAFSWETVTIEGKDISTKISKKVLSMRQVRNVITAYKKSTYPLFYHLYTEFISDQWGGGTNDEMEAFLTLAHDTGLMPAGLRTDKLDYCKENVKKWIRTLKQGVNHHEDTKLVGWHDEAVTVNNELLDTWSLVLTKQDIYEAYFGKKLEDIDDMIFGSDELEKHLAERKKTNNFEEESEPEREITLDELLDQIEELKTILKNSDQYTSNNFFNKLEFNDLFMLESAVDNLWDKEGAFFNESDQKKKRLLWQAFNKILNWINEWEEISDEEFDEVMDMMRTFS